MSSMRWNGWGDPDQATVLPDAVGELLTQLLGVSADRTPAPVDPGQVSLPPAPLPARFADRLAAAIGPDHVSSTLADRLAHTRGKSTVDILRLRRGDAADAPDAVARPASHDEVLAVLDLCSTDHVAVVPFGGGTSVVGGLAPAREGFAGVVALDLARLVAPTTVDPVSRTAVLAAGLTGPAAEARLAEHGFTLGH